VAQDRAPSLPEDWHNESSGAKAQAGVLPESMLTAELSKFSSSEQESINKWLSAGQHHEIANTPEMNKLLDKLPVYSGTVYRGANLSDDKLATIKPGGTLEFNGNKSATSVRDIAYMFAATQIGQGAKPDSGSETHDRYAELPDQNAVIFEVNGAKTADLREITNSIYSGFAMPSSHRPNEVVLRGGKYHIDAVKQYASNDMTVSPDDMRPIVIDGRSVTVVLLRHA
jgi:hypothetical protein